MSPLEAPRGADAERGSPELDALVAQGPTYRGWQEDVHEAEVGDGLLGLGGFQQHIDKTIQKIRRKQAMHIGDRSHPQLVELDALVAQGLTYRRW